MNILRNNTILLTLVALIVIVPLALPIAEKMEEPFSGSDDQAEGVISQIAPDYKPWFSSIWEPPSSEIESLLFALQAALGTGVLAYYIGYRRGLAKRDETRQD